MHFADYFSFSSLTLLIGLMTVRVKVVFLNGSNNDLKETRILIANKDNVFVIWVNDIWIKDSVNSILFAW